MTTSLGAVRSRAATLATGAALKALAPLLDLAVPKRGYTLEAGIAYGGHPRQKLDVYLPDDLANRAPVLVFYYGGTWQTGNRAIYRFVGEAFASAGIVTVVPDYRLYPAVRYPTFLEDSALAVAWTKGNIVGRGGDPANLFVSGHSAGAYNALMLALDRRCLRAVGCSPTDLRGALGLSGPYDFLPIHNDPVLVDLFGSATDMTTQPIKYAAGQHPPVFLGHGTKDMTVGPGNSRRLAKRLRAAGNEVTLAEYDGFGHIRPILALAHGFRGIAPVRADMLRFIERTATASQAKPVAINGELLSATVLRERR